MTFPFVLPDWMPWWVPIVVMVPVLLYLAIFLLMPFSVFGLRGRLEAIEAQLDDLREQLRMALDPTGEALEEEPLPRRAPAPPGGREALSGRTDDFIPPPPASFRPDPRRQAPPPPPPPPPPRPERMEPRLGWPR